MRSSRLERNRWFSSSATQTDRGVSSSKSSCRDPLGDVQLGSKGSSCLLKTLWSRALTGLLFHRWAVERKKIWALLLLHPPTTWLVSLFFLFFFWCPASKLQYSCFKFYITSLHIKIPINKIGPPLCDSVFTFQTANTFWIMFCIMQILILNMWVKSSLTTDSLMETKSIIELALCGFWQHSVNDKDVPPRSQPFRDLHQSAFVA